MSKETYRVTPKAFLALETGTDLDEFSQIWDKFTAFVKERAAKDGMDGIPGLVLIGGGKCIAFEEPSDESEGRLAEEEKL